MTLDLTKTKFDEHPGRASLNGEVHARPFPRVEAPGHALFLALRCEDAERRDRALDHAALEKLITHYGAEAPEVFGAHHQVDLGEFVLKWENHTEITSYTIIFKGLPKKAFDESIMDVFPDGWLAEAQGEVISAILFQIEVGVEPEEMERRINDVFERESLAAAEVLDGSLVVATDYHINDAGFTRVAMFPTDQCGPQRIGRVLQRLCEIETYMTLSLLGMNQARMVLSEVSELERKLGRLKTRLAGEEGEEIARSQLDDVLSLTTKVETLLGLTSFRFGATRAYEGIVLDRISALEEVRFANRQTFREFMRRRYDPAMRTVEAANRQLNNIAERGARAANLLRTKVDVERQGQTQAVLGSLDRRAHLQLRLQETVEGLSVVAISYYAVGLIKGMLDPIIHEVGVSKAWSYAILTPVTVLIVWLILRRMKRYVAKP